MSRKRAARIFSSCATAKSKPRRLTSILPGITRESIITLARDKGYQVIEERFTRDELYIADEAFFTGTAAELTPIREVDDRQIGAGRRGPVTEDIQNAFFDVIKGKERGKVRELALSWYDLSRVFQLNFAIPASFNTSQMALASDPTLRVTMLPRDTNARGTIFGGVILSHIDLAGGIAAARRAARNFRHPGDARGRVHRAGLRRRCRELLHNRGSAKATLR